MLSSTRRSIRRRSPRRTSSLLGPTARITGLTITEYTPSPLPTGETPESVAHPLLPCHLPAETANGAYVMTIGPDITDVTGNLMNQNGDGINGEPSKDSYTARFTRNATAATVGLPVVFSLRTNGDIVANYSNGVDAYDTIRCSISCRPRSPSLMPLPATWTATANSITSLASPRPASGGPTSSRRASPRRSTGVVGRVSAPSPKCRAPMSTATAPRHARPVGNNSMWASPTVPASSRRYGRR